MGALLDDARVPDTQRVGEPIGNFYGYESVDIDENGEWIVLNEEGEQIPIRDVNEDDRRIIGNGVPKQYLSLNNTARLGSFDLNVNMRGAFGFDILNFQEMYYANPTILQYNMLESAFDPVYGKRPVDYDLAYVSYYVEDGDYWKLDNVTLGYTLGEGLLGRVGNVVNNATIQFDQAGTGTYGGVISGTGSFVKSGAGMLTLASSHTFSGQASIAAGTLRAGTTNVFSPTTGVSVAAGATFDLNGFNQSIGTLSGGGNFTLGSATLTTGGDTYCWGSSQYQQLGSAVLSETCGNGTFACSSTPG